MVRIPPMHCCSSSELLSGTKFISVLDAFASIFLGFILARQVIRAVKNVLFYYNLFLTVMFLFMSYYSLRACWSLRKEMPDWSRVKKYYKAKIIRIFCWIVEWGIVAIWWVLEEPEISPLYGYSILNAIGVIVDINFCYVIYSCYKLGVQGHLRNEIVQATGSQSVMPDYNEVEAIGMDNTQDAFNQSSVKEVIAYSQDNLKVIDLNSIPIHDFTKVDQ
ncbi:unnamed protein product [Blepharisma stoltei]|uniref:Uncharacterized protein n=1 Tax=Blepharisma stoltei TaxID=1481888 RepID=A0AAU9JMR7_9CILI|nr:unnamed protein product [Blepharisma stoltei]